MSKDKSGLKRITIIGLGLIGGSLARDLRTRYPACRIIGVDANPNHVERALQMGLADEFREVKEAVGNAELVIIAVPVDKAGAVLLDVLDHISAGTVVLDMGSTKQKICEQVMGHPKRGQFVACHPIAGTENSGPDAAIEDLFKGKVSIVCAKEESSEFALGRALELMEALGMQPVFMSPKSHDKHIAYVSHLSHISSFALGQTVLEIEKNESNIFEMAGSGFASTVRLAKSSPEMWGPIFLENAENISDALECYIQNLIRFKDRIDRADLIGLKQVMNQTNTIRRILDEK